VGHRRFRPPGPMPTLPAKTRGPRPPPKSLCRQPLRGGLFVQDAGSTSQGPIHGPGGAAAAGFLLPLPTTNVVHAFLWVAAFFLRDFLKSTTPLPSPVSRREKERSTWLTLFNGHQLFASQACTHPSILLHYNTWPVFGRNRFALGDF